MRRRNGFLTAGLLLTGVLAALILLSNQRAIGVRKSYATVGGKGGRSTLMPLGAA